MVPRPWTRFIGRQQEIVEIRKQLKIARLLTLVGAGGCGKTRLALEVIGGQEREFEDGICWVSLATLTNAALVPWVVASTLGLCAQSEDSLLSSLTRYLQAKKLLLVLDNCEHVVAA